MTDHHPLDQPDVTPVTGSRRITDGARIDDASPAGAFSPPPRSPRSGSGERLLILLELTNNDSLHRRRELRQTIAQTYWESSGSITAGLRRAAAAANRQLFWDNLSATPKERCYAGLTCAIVRENDVFLLQAGPSFACIITQRGEMFIYPRAKRLAHMGIGQTVDTRLDHAFVAPGDRLLIASPALYRAAGPDALSRVLPRPDLNEILDGLEQVAGGTDFSALVARLEAAGQEGLEKTATAGPGTTQAEDREPEIPAKERSPARKERPVKEARLRPQTRTEPEGRPKVQSEPKPGSEPVALEPRERQPAASSSTTPPASEKRSGIDWTQAFQSVGQAGRRAASSVGGGIVSAGAWIGRGARDLFLAMLPGVGPKRERSRPQRPVPKENRTVMMSIALALPLVVLVIVVLAYGSFGRQARFTDVMAEAKAATQLAQQAESLGEPAREHWEAALDKVEAALELNPGDPEAAALETQARMALDQLDGVVRQSPKLLHDFGASNNTRRLVSHGQSVYTLDPGAGWVDELSLQTLESGELEAGSDQLIVRSGQRVQGEVVGDLVDMAWVNATPLRQPSALLILEKEGALISYDPRWEPEASQSPVLSRALLESPPGGSPRYVDSFEGHFYVLDTEEDQIKRYVPQGDAYPGDPDDYFVEPPPKALDTALDMEINGNIYILYADGTILKFWDQIQKPFTIQGLPGSLTQPVDMAVDPDHPDSRVYVADRGNRRIITLEADGTFVSQIQASGGEFDALEAVAVQRDSGRLFVLSGGTLYWLPLHLQ